MTQIIDVQITYLEQKKRPALPVPTSPGVKVAILRAETPPVHFYRYLYATVGDPYYWISRKVMSDEELQAIIQSPDVYIYVLYVGGVPAGLAEIDARKPEIGDLRFFGLTPDFVGKGYGRYFLAHAIDLCWAHGPERVTVETCTLDHPAALSLYQKLGFSVFDQRRGQVELPDDVEVDPSKLNALP